MSKAFSIHDIEAAWKEYTTVQVLRILRQGKWHTEVMDGRPRGNFDGTQAKIQFMKDVMDFPEYMRDLWKS